MDKVEQIKHSLVERSSITKTLNRATKNEDLTVRELNKIKEETRVISDRAINHAHVIFDSFKKFVNDNRGLYDTYFLSGRGAHYYVGRISDKPEKESFKIEVNHSYSDGETDIKPILIPYEFVRDPEAYKKTRAKYKYEAQIKMQKDSIRQIESDIVKSKQNIENRQGIILGLEENLDEVFKRIDAGDFTDIIPKRFGTR